MAKNRPNSKIVTLTLDSALHAQAKSLAEEASLYLGANFATCRIIDHALALGMPLVREKLGLPEVVPQKRSRK